MATKKVPRGRPPKLRVLLEEQEIPTEEFVLYASDMGHVLNLERSNYDPQEVMDLVGDFRNRTPEANIHSDEY